MVRVWGQDTGPVGGSEEEESEEVRDEEEDAQNIVRVEEARPDLLAPSMWKTDVNLKTVDESGGDTAEGLLGVPGTYVRRSGGFGSRAVVTVRGAGSGQVKVLLDGVPLNPARGGGVDLSLFPSSVLKSAQLYRGAAGARFGRGALGGALNLVPRVLGDEQGTHGALRVGVGSFGQYRLGGSLGLSSETSSGLVVLDYEEIGGGFTFEDDQGSVKTRVNADARRLSLLGISSFSPRPTTTLRVTSLTGLVERGAPGPSEFQEVFSDARRALYDTTLSVVWDERDLVKSPHVLVDQTTRMSWRRGLQEYENPTRFLRSTSPYESENREHGLTLSTSLAAYGEWWTLRAGFDGEREGLGRTYVSFDGLNLDESFSRDVLAGVFSGEILALEDTLSVVVSSRFESVDGAFPEPTPALGVRMQVAPSWTLMGNISRSWRPPSLDELFLRAESIEGDPNLRPERAWGADLGVRSVWEDVVRAEVAGFFLETNDLILFLPISATQLRAQNAGVVRSFGAEISGAWMPVPWSSLEGAYTWTRATFLAAPRAPLPGRPEHVWSVTSSWGPKDTRAFVRAHGRSTLFLDNFGNLQNPPWTAIDAGLHGRFWTRWKLSITGRNLLDQKSAVDALQLPLPGRSVYINAAWEHVP